MKIINILKNFARSLSFVDRRRRHDSSVSVFAFPSAHSFLLFASMMTIWDGIFHLKVVNAVACETTLFVDDLSCFETAYRSHCSFSAVSAHYRFYDC